MSVFMGSVQNGPVFCLFIFLDDKAEERIVTVPHREVRVPDVVVEVQAEGPAPLWLLLYSRGVVPTSARKTLEK